MKKNLLTTILILTVLTANLLTSFAAALPSNSTSSTKQDEVCEHDETKKENISSKVEAIKNDDNFHSIIETYDEVCENEKCEKVLKKGQTSTKTEKHSFSNGICEICGYEKKCAHGKKQTITDPNTEIKPLTDDAAYHLVITYSQEQCVDCKEFLSERKATENKEPHTFSNDICKCGYKKDTSCKHKTKTTSERTECIMIDGNETKHNVIVHTDEICTDECKQIISSSRSEPKEENHIMQNNKCKCGFEIIIQEETEQKTEAEEETELEKAIKFLSENNIMIGDENGSFNPEKDMTRAEYAKIVCNFVGSDIDLSNNKTDFSDVSNNHWAYDYIVKANQAGLLLGYGDNTFGINDTLTEEQAVTVLCRMLGNTYEDVLFIEEVALEQGGYSEGYITIAGDKGINLGGLHHGIPATRARVAKWLYQLYNIKNNL